MGTLASDGRFLLSGSTDVRLVFLLLLALLTLLRSIILIEKMEIRSRDRPM